MKSNFILACLVMLFVVGSLVMNGKYHFDINIINSPTTMKITHLHFFIHETFSGDNPSAVLIAKPNGTMIDERNALPFGALYVIDNPLTKGPSPNSKVIGSSRGFYGSTTRGSDLTLLFSGEFGFTSGVFNGSSISVFSRDPPFASEKELAVVDGIGKFRMAKGFLLVKLIFSNATASILECDATIFH